MERKGEATKHQLAESFKELMLKGSFDKITIRMITEQAGVIRPTFYNYFQDKYEVMEWLLEEEVFRPVFEMVEDGMEREAIYLLFRKMEKDQQYYQKAFEVTGQNGFEEILTGQTGFQLIVTLDSVDCCAGSAETMTASTSSFQSVTGILHSCHNCQFCRHTIFFTEKIYIYHFFHLSVPVLS